MLQSAFVVLALLCLSQLAFGADHDHPKFHNAKRNKKSVEGKIFMLLNSNSNYLLKLAKLSL
jgi:hypothetical protein